MSVSDGLRPFKVWSSDRCTKKGVVATSLKELISTGRTKLGYSPEEELTLVLEEDGTEVDDDGYLSCLDDNTTFLLLKQHQRWLPLAASSDEPDHTPGYTECDGPAVQSAQDTSRPLADIVRIVGQNVSKTITLSSREMEMLVEVEASELAVMMGSSLDEARHLQQTTQRYLDDRQKALEAIELLQLYESQKGHTATKRQRRQ